MDGKSRLTTVKTLKYCVFERCGEQGVAASPSASRSAVTSESDTKVVDYAIRTNAFSHSSSREGAEAPRFPPTEKNYMLDTYQMTAEATVLGIVRDEKQGTAIILDKTIFHPQGGGQPSDQGTITCNGASCTVSVSMVRDVGGVIHHFGEVSGFAVPSSVFHLNMGIRIRQSGNIPAARGLVVTQTDEPTLPLGGRRSGVGGSVPEKPGDRASLSLDGAKRTRHAVLHSAGHAVDTAMVAAAGAGVFSPSKGYHFEDSPYVEYLGALPDPVDKNAFLGKLNSELEKLVAADMETKVEFLSEEHDGVTNGNGTRSRSHVGATRIVTVADLACPCGGTHVRSTRDLEGVRVTKLKAKKGTLRVSYVVPSAA